MGCANTKCANVATVPPATSLGGDFDLHTDIHDKPVSTDDERAQTEDVAEEIARDLSVWMKARKVASNTHFLNARRIQAGLRATPVGKPPASAESEVVHESCISVKEAIEKAISVKQAIEKAISVKDAIREAGGAKEPVPSDPTDSDASTPNDTSPSGSDGSPTDSDSDHPDSPKAHDEAPAGRTASASLVRRPPLAETRLRATHGLAPSVSCPNLVTRPALARARAANAARALYMSDAATTEEEVDEQAARVDPLQFSESDTDDRPPTKPPASGEDADGPTAPPTPPRHRRSDSIRLAPSPPRSPTAVRFVATDYIEEMIHDLDAREPAGAAALAEGAALAEAASAAEASGAGAGALAGALAAWDAEHGAAAQLDYYYDEACMMGFHQHVQPSAPPAREEPEEPPARVSPPEGERAPMPVERKRAPTPDCWEERCADTDEPLPAGPPAPLELPGAPPAPLYIFVEAVEAAAAPPGCGAPATSPPLSPFKKEVPAGAPRTAPTDPSARPVHPAHR